eukprot:s6852_g4.t1
MLTVSKKIHGRLKIAVVTIDFDVGQSRALKPQTHIDCPGNACFSSDGKFVATASKDACAKVWSLSTGDCLRSVTGHNQWVRCVAFALLHGLGWCRHGSDAADIAAAASSAPSGPL